MIGVRQLKHLISLGKLVHTSNITLQVFDTTQTLLSRMKVKQPTVRPTLTFCLATRRATQLYILQWH